MADEFRHGDVVSGRITENEYEAIGEHVFNSQATGDMLIATSVTQLSRLGITNDRILVSSGGLFSWDNTLPSFTLGGTVTLGGQAFDAGAGYLEIDTTGKAGILMDGGIFSGGAIVRGYYQNHFGGAFLSDGGSTVAYKFFIDGAFTSAIGNTTRIAAVRIAPSITTQNNTETVGEVGSVIISEPLITLGTDAITLAATLIVRDAPTEGATNAAIAIVAGDMKFLGSVDSAAIADQVAIGAYEIAPGERSLAISQENPVVNAAAGASDNYLPVRINGATYKLLLHS